MSEHKAVFRKFVEERLAGSDLDFADRVAIRWAASELDRLQAENDRLKQMTTDPAPPRA